MPARAGPKAILISLPLLSGTAKAPCCGPCTSRFPPLSGKPKGQHPVLAGPSGMRRPPPACWISSMTTEDRNQRTRKPVESLADGKRTGKTAVIKNGGLAWVSGSRRTFTLGIAGLSADPSSVPMRRPVRCLAWPDLSASLKSRQGLRVQSYCHVALSGKRLCAVHQHFHQQGHERLPGLPSVGAEFVGRGQAARFGRRSAAHGGQGGEFHALRSRRRGPVSSLRMHAG